MIITYSAKLAQEITRIFSKKECFQHKKENENKQGFFMKKVKEMDFTKEMSKDDKTFQKTFKIL